MKFLMLCALGAVVLGGIYHEDLARAWRQAGSGSSSGVTSSMGGLGGATSSTMGGIGNSLGQ